jgi:hypothetical protein
MAVITERASACPSFRTFHARAHVGDTQEGGRPYVLTGSKPRKSPGAPPACAPLPPPPTSQRQHSHNLGRVLSAVTLTSIITTF